MNEQEIRRVVLAGLASVAPELDVAQLKPDVPLRRQVDLDSFDWLHFLVALDEQLHIAIPESDYQKLTTLDALVAYLVAKAGAAKTP